jgi:hypothetical protein
MPLTLDADFLGAALVGYQQIHKQIESRMADLRHRLHVGPTASSPAAAARVAKNWKLSPEGRAHIVAAQRARWAAARKAKKTASAPAPPKPSAKKAPLKRAGRTASAKATQKRVATKKAVAELPATPPPNTQTSATE